MLEDFNYLENQTTKSWTNNQDDSKTINFQVFNELGINNIGVFEKNNDSKIINFQDFNELRLNDKDDKIDSSFSFDINSNYLNRKNENKN